MRGKTVRTQFFTFREQFDSLNSYNQTGGKKPRVVYIFVRLPFIVIAAIVVDLDHLVTVQWAFVSASPPATYTSVRPPCTQHKA